MAGRSCHNPGENDSDLDSNGHGGYGKKWLHSGFVLKVKLTNLVPGWVWDMR